MHKDSEKDRFMLNIDLSEVNFSCKESLDNFVRFIMVHGDKLEEARRESVSSYENRTQDFIDIYNAGVEVWTEERSSIDVIYHINNSAFANKAIARWKEKRSKVPASVREKLKEYELRIKGHEDSFDDNLQLMEWFLEKYADEVHDVNKLAKDLLHVFTETRY